MFCQIVNWSPQMAKEKTKQKLLLKPLPDPPKHRSDPKYKPEKAPAPRADYKSCPFCLMELPEVTRRVKEEIWLPVKGKNIERLHITYSWPRRALKCACGARRVTKGCPACKHNTWFQKSTGIYKHAPCYGCGFVGVKKQ